MSIFTYFFRAGNSLIRSSLLFAHLLILLKSNERLLAIRSDWPRQMSDHERITQVAKDIWATVINFLRSLKGNEQFAKKNLAKKI